MEAEADIKGIVRGEAGEAGCSRGCWVGSAGKLAGGVLGGWMQRRSGGCGGRVLGAVLGRWRFVEGSGQVVGWLGNGSGCLVATAAVSWGGKVVSENGRASGSWHCEVPWRGAGSGGWSGNRAQRGMVLC